MSPILVVVLVVLVDLMGFTLVMPLLPRFAAEYGFSDAKIGILLAAYPMCQLVAGPILGRLSDRYGRRPVLAVSQFGTALSFLILGLTNNYTWMLVGRMLDGASGGNFLVAQAYVADVTTPERRSRGLGLIGMAFGIGFTLGPLLGGLLLKVPLGPAWTLRLPFLVAAGFSTIAWILVLLYLPESRPPGRHDGPTARVLSWRGVLDLLRSPTAALLVAVGAFDVLAFAALEGTFSLFLKRRLGWDAAEASYAFAFLGFVSAVVQGGLIRRLVPRFGEPRLILVGLATLAVGLAGLALAGAWAGLFAALVAVGVGQGIASPTIQGLLSRTTPESEQGAVFGTLTSAQTLARMINYFVAARLLGDLGPAAPFWEGSAFAIVALALAIWATLGRIGLDYGRDAGALPGLRLIEGTPDPTRVGEARPR